MNHNCHGDIFFRWAKRFGRCLADSSFFSYEIGIEFCPSCKRPWLGTLVEKQHKTHGYKPNDDPAVALQIDLPHFKMLADERKKKIAYLEAELSRWQGMYYKAAGMDYLASVHEASKNVG